MHKLYIVVEVSPGREGDFKEPIAIRERKEDAEKVRKVLAETADNFELYEIEEREFEE